MDTLELHRKSLKVWTAIFNGRPAYISPKANFNTPNETFLIIEQFGSRIGVFNTTTKVTEGVPVANITVYDDLNSGSAETFANVTLLALRLEELAYPAFYTDSQISSIAGLISAGTNITFTGAGTLADPFVISSSGGSGTTPNLSQVLTVRDRTSKTISTAYTFVNSDRTEFLVGLAGDPLTLNDGVFNEDSEIHYKNISGDDVILNLGVGVVVYTDGITLVEAPDTITIPTGSRIILKYNSGFGWMFNIIGFSASSGESNLGYTPSPDDGTITNDNGDDATIPLADATNAGLLKPADFSKLASITAIFTTALKTAYDAVVSDFTALIATGVRLITSGEITKLSNTSGTNSGDNATNTQYSGLAASKEDTANKSTSTGDSASSVKFPVWSAVVTYVTGLGYLLASTASSTYQVILTETVFGTFLNSLSAKTTPLDADLINIIDTADSNKAKKVTFTNVKAFLKTYFDTVYTTTSAVASQITTALSGYLTAATAASTYQAILTAVNFGAFSSALSAKTTIVDADTTNISDSADGSNTKKVTWVNVWTNYIKAKADLVYQAILVSGTTIKTVNSQTLLGSGDISGVVGTLSVITTGVGTVGAGEDDLISYTVAGNTLANNGDYLGFDNSGIFAGSLNSKRLRVKFGSNTLFDTGALSVTVASDWSVKGRIIRTSSTTFKAVVSFTSSFGTLMGSADYTTGSETFSGSILLKSTGDATADDDVRQELQIVSLNSQTTDALLSYALKASPTFTGTVTTPAIIVSSETASRVAIIDGSKNVKSADTATYPSLAELAYLKGVTAGIQSQIDGKLYNLLFTSLTLSSPLDTTAYYISQISSAPGTTDTSRAFNFGFTGTLKQALLTVSQTTNGSGEDVTIYLRNITTNTDYTIGVWTSNFGTNTGKGFFFSGLSIPISSTDSYTVKIVTPAWATNPANHFYNATLSILK